MKSTITVLDHPRSGGARRARLYVVLEASRPLSGSARWSLTDVEEVRIGRGERRAGRRAQVDGASQLDITVADPRLSAVHARVARVGGKWVLEDAGSKNGTRVNRESVKVRSADGGTLVLDEIGDLPLSAQAALLRVLQEREVRPVGATKPVGVDLRVVAATHRALDDLVAGNEFRADLLARLRGYEIALPALRDRLPDLGLIVADLLRRLAPDRTVTFELDAARALVGYAWPLNVRELEQALSVAIGLSGGDRIQLEHLPASVQSALQARPENTVLGDDDLALCDRVSALLREHSGNVSAVARAMGKDRKQIRRWIERFGIRLESST